MQPIEIRWSWLATYDRKIRRRQQQQAALREALRAFHYQCRFMITVRHPHTKEWFNHGPCRAHRLTATHLLYWHETHDQNAKKPRRMPRHELLAALRKNRVALLPTSGSIPSTT